MVDQILPIRTHVALKGHRTAYPACLVDEDSRLGFRPVGRVVAGRLERKFVAAAFPHGRRRAQRDSDVRFALVGRIDSDERELRVVYPALGIGQRLVDHSGERIVTAERGGIHAVFDLDGVFEDFGGALADLRRATRDDAPRLGARFGEWTAVGQYPGGQAGVELGQTAGRSIDDHCAHRADFRRTLHRLPGSGCGRARPGDRLVEHHRGDGNQHRQRVGAPAVGGHKTSQPTLFAPATIVPIRPDPSRAPREGVPLGAQRFSPVVAENRRPVAPAPLGLVGHFHRMAQPPLAGTLGAPEGNRAALTCRHSVRGWPSRMLVGKWVVVSVRSAVHRCGGTTTIRLRT